VDLPAGEQQPVFFYDLGEPECYLAAERIMAALPVVPEWEPVLGAEFESPDVERTRFEARAAEYGLQAVRWPRAWPPDTRTAMLAATFAKRGGRAVAFSLAAFRQAFAGGRDLGEESTVLIAAAACEMHPAAVLKGIGMRSVTGALATAGERARAAGVETLPAIQISQDQLFTGSDAVERAASALAGARA
jgi:2-hydroxychromene-2-carboxylate isomerase